MITMKTVKILIVDDDLMNQLMLQQMLREFVDIEKLVMASHGRECLDLLAIHHDTDLIILDLDMPVMGGEETLAHIRDSHHLKNISVIVAAGNRDAAIRTLARGADDFISKPYDALELRFRIMNLLQKKNYVVKSKLDNERLVILTDELAAKNVQLEFDINVRKQTEMKLRMLTRAIEQSPVTIVITDIDGKIEYVNPHFTELTGYAYEEAIGQNPRLLKSGETPPEVFEKLWATIKAGETWEGEILNKSKDGSLFWEHTVITALRDEGVITNYVAIKENITERIVTQKQLVIEKMRAESATQAKSSFLATMSHEIRTPMNGVIGMTSLLLDTELDEEQREYIGIVQKSSEHLMGLINDILDFTKIEAGKLDVEILSFDLCTTVEDTIEMFALRAFDKNLELMCRIDPDVPSYLKGDPGRLRQIMSNLLANSIKFTETGEINVRVKLASDCDGFVIVLFEVHDSGIGIPTDRIDTLFFPFTQLDGSTTRKYGGTGLGLAICKQLVELMGGEIGARSETEKGSTFWFTAQFEKQAVRMVPDHASIPSFDHSGVRILVIDDNSTNRKLMTTLLAQWGYQYGEAHDGSSAYDILLHASCNGEPFHMALLDHEMPGMNGLELGQNIKSNPLISKTLLVMVTSLGQRGDAAILKQIGFVGYMTKPVRHTLMKDCIALALGRAQQGIWSSSEAAELITRHTIAESKKKPVRILLAEDNVINQKIVQRMLISLGYKADVVANGHEAVNALKLIDYDLVLMDCAMPEMHGYEATAIIRNSDFSTLKNNIPIIALTVNATTGDLNMCFGVGMNDYLAKPVIKTELTVMVEKWLSH